MRLLLCEFVTAGGFGRAPIPDGLAREGDAMLQGLVKDLAALGGHRLTVLRDRRLAPLEPAATTLAVGAGEDPGDSLWPRLPRALEACDAFWPIAPESDGALERLTRAAGAAGRRVLGSDAEAVALCASKAGTCRRLVEQGVPTVPTALERPPDEASEGPWIVKPDDGAGCEETWRIVGRQRLEAFLGARAGGPPFVVQPWVEGTAASLSLLCRDGRAWLLACNSQTVTVEPGEVGRLAYHGGVVGGLERRRPAFTAIAEAVARAIPGLWGYVGVDLIDSVGGPLVVDVNPRLTSAYGALGAALGFNPAALVLALLEQPLDQLARSLALRPTAIAGGGHGG